MSQVGFSFAILQAAKNERIHTCIETSGCGSQSLYERILPVTDLFLFDYKITGREEHKQNTGLYDDLIRSNLDFIYSQHKPIILRCPIIPGINDTELHFHGIAALGRSYPNLMGIEILPYHDLGNSKRTGIGKELTLVGLKTTPPELANEWVNMLHSIGCTKAQIG
jgi:pyruvate formate lyase activating enzyme